MKIFISYAKVNEGIAKELSDIIKYIDEYIEEKVNGEKGEEPDRKITYETFFDKNDMLPGSIITDEIVKGLRECNFFVLLLTAESFKSKWVQMEIGGALVGGLSIIPVQYGAIEDKNILDALNPRVIIEYSPTSQDFKMKEFAMQLKELFENPSNSVKNFKEGDWVRLPNKKHKKNKVSNLTWNAKMNRYCDEVTRIVKIVKDKKKRCYAAIVEIDNLRWLWALDWLIHWTPGEGDS